MGVVSGLAISDTSCIVWRILCDCRDVPYCGCWEIWSGAVGSADRKVPREVSGFTGRETGFWSRDTDISKGRSAIIFKGVKP